MPSVVVDFHPVDQDGPLLFFAPNALSIYLLAFVFHRRRDWDVNLLSSVPAIAFGRALVSLSSTANGV
ncbi:hypothetical protein BDZ89DRAFT_1134948 [Hymenopellis radicata]|nr:hypothetical protein BDZ89DRAFT_1134948 [Hymenopellis radicata]